MTARTATPVDTTPGDRIGSTGSWVTGQLGIELTVTPAGEAGAPYARAVELGLRVNPNRAQLLVSGVLGKHIPVPASTVLRAGQALGAAVRSACDGVTPVVVGFAETATGLGHAVAAVAADDGGTAPYVHTTRRPAPAGATVVEFREEHSHATEQVLAVVDDVVLATDAPLVLVDDELSTGNTAANAIRALQARWPRRRYILASLLDSRTAAQHAAVREQVAALGACVTSVMLLTGALTLPDDVLERAHAVRAALPAGLAMIGADAVDATEVHEYEVALHAPTTAAYGWTQADEAAAVTDATNLAGRLPVHHDERTLVLGDEEFMYIPQLLAAALGEGVQTSTTTRSPAVSIDTLGYPLRTSLSFGSTEDASRPAFAYNVAPSRLTNPGNAPGFEDIVLVTDASLDGLAATTLLEQLAAVAARSVHVVNVFGCNSARRDATAVPARPHSRQDFPC